MLLLLFKRFFGKSGVRTEAADGERTSPESVVARITQGEPGLRDTFIAAYRPYIAKATSRFCKRYIDPSQDDEFSIALAAFNEAIDQYSPSAGRSFLGFADTVIRRRLIDYVRKEQRHFSSVPMSAFESMDEEDTPVNPVEISAALDRYEKERQSELRRYEIEAFSARLSSYGISFMELVDKSPKHIDSRAMLYNIGGLLARDLQLFEMLEAKGQLPVKELTERSGVSRKTVERNRKFIIACALIMEGDYPHLKAYMQLPDNRTNLVEEGVGS